METNRFDGLIYSAETLEYGRLNYETYKNMVGGKTWNGDDMLPFHEMPERLQKAWTKSAVEVHNFALLERLKGEKFTVSDYVDTYWYFKNL